MSRSLRFSPRVTSRIRSRFWMPVGRVLGLLVLEDVDLADVLVAVGLVPLLVQAHQVRRRSPRRRAPVDLLDAGSASLAASSSGRGRAAQRGLQLPCAPPPSWLALRPHQPRHPVHRPQLVQHGPADAGHAVRLELHAAGQVERVDRVHQAEHAGGDQVVQLHAVGQPRPDPLGVVLDQRQVAFDEHGSAAPRSAARGTPPTPPEGRSRLGSRSQSSLIHGRPRSHVPSGG